MYQVRITDADGSNPIILEKADKINYNKVINSKSEGISFELPTSDNKSALVTSTKIWELWDTVANKRKNRGPIHSLDYSDSGVLKVSGPGRSQFLADHVKPDVTAFYEGTASLINNLRFENVAAGPSTKTYVWDGDAAKKTIFFPADITVDTDKYMQYYGLSKQTKDNAIDDNTGYILPGTEKPSNTFTTTDSYWSGTDKKDSLVIDLGSTFSIDHITITFPTWGGNQRITDRGYAFRFYYSTDTGDFDTLNPANWVLAHEDTGGKHLGTWIIYFSNGTNYSSYIYVGPVNIDIRYLRIVITDVKAWYGSYFDTAAAIDMWDWQCNPNTTNTRIDASGRTLPPAMKDKTINDRTLEPANDCHASIVEVAVAVEIVEQTSISDLVKQRIKTDNRQITYFHAADASETKTVGNYRKYEPGDFFRHVNISYSGASSSYTKFFDSDCTNCYGAFNFGIQDDFNSLIYHSTSSSGSNLALTIPRFTSNITMKGASNAVVNSVDSWPAVLDPLSWSGKYSYNTKIGDYLTLNFRGQSFIWWATVPSTATGATVLIKIRSKNDGTGTWSGWTTLEAGFQVPNNITSEVIYEIPYATTLTSGVTYEIYIENLDGGYVSIDSFGGWWSASSVDYNDDWDRIFMSNPDGWKQIYDNRFSNGTMSKTNSTSLIFAIIGDRIQFFSAKGRNHGKLDIIMTQISTVSEEFDPVGVERVFIPGGDPSTGILTIDLNTGTKGYESPNVLVFDTAELTGWKFGSGGTPMDALPWQTYYFQVGVSHTNGTYLADPTAEDSDQFVARCSDCNSITTGTESIKRFIFSDGFTINEIVRISGSWKLQTNLDILASITEALELEWDIGEQGLTVSPRIGADTDIILKEGINTVISMDIIQDGSKMASQLFSSGADIDGLPLFSIVEDRKNREILGRTVQQIQDYRDLADYFTLIGVSRAELVRRREPEYRLTASHIGYKYGLEAGDSIILKKNTLNPIRARINSVVINQSKSGGITYDLECEKWPPIV